MLLTVLQVERCQGGDWSLCYKSFTEFHHMMPNGEANAIVAKSNGLDAAKQGGIDWGELIVDFPMPFLVQETLKMIPFVCTSLMMMYG